MYDTATSENNHGVRFGAAALTIALGVWGAFGWFKSNIEGVTGPAAAGGMILVVLALISQFMANMGSAQVRRARTKQLGRLRFFWQVCTFGFSAFSAASADWALFQTGIAQAIPFGPAKYAVLALFGFLAFVEPWMAWGIEGVERAPLPDDKPIMPDAEKKPEPPLGQRVRDLAEQRAKNALGNAAAGVAAFLAIAGIGQAIPAHAKSFAANDGASTQGRFDFDQAQGAERVMTEAEREAAKDQAAHLLCTTELSDYAIAAQTGLHRQTVLRLRRKLEPVLEEMRGAA